MGRASREGWATAVAAVWCVASCHDAPPRWACGPSALRLRGGATVGRGTGAFSDASRGVADEDEFFHKFGSGPGHLDMSSSKFEVRPDSFNDTDSLMDGMGMWDYPTEYRLLGEHFPSRVVHRVRTSPYLRQFWEEHNFTDCHDGWDHQSDRLGTVLRVTDDGRSCEVKWDAEDGKDGVADWYATGYLTNYFLSLAEDALQPEFPDDAAVQARIHQLEDELRALRGERGLRLDDDGNML